MSCRTRFGIDQVKGCHAELVSASPDDEILKQVQDDKEREMLIHSKTLYGVSKESLTLKDNKMWKRVGKFQIKLLWFLTVIFCLLPVNSLFAGISVEPVRQEISVVPGKEAQGGYFVYNVGKEPTHVTVGPRDWFVLEENRGIKVDSWLKIMPQELDLEPGERKEVKYEVAVPTGAIGELVAMISFVPQAEEESTINVVFSVSLYVMIEGTEILRGEISKVDIRRWESEGSSDLRLAVLVENRGNVHLRPKGKIVIEDMKGKEIKEVELTYGWPVYPGKNRGYFGDWKGARLESGKYRAIATVDYGDPEKILRETVTFKVDKKGNIEMGEK